MGGGGEGLQYLLDYLLPVLGSGRGRKPGGATTGGHWLPNIIKYRY